MRSRVWISALLALWCQFLVLGTPIAEAIGAARAGHVELQCTCGTHDAGAMCPMHHSPAKKSSNDAHCTMSQGDTPLPGFVFATGTLPEPSLQLATPAEPGMPIAVIADRILARSTSLDPPPPRS